MNKSIKFLLILFIALFILVLVLNKSLYKTNGKKLFKYNFSKIQFLSLKNKNSKLVLKKINNQWRLTNNKPVSPAQLDRAIDTMKNFTIKDLVSRNKQKQISFQVANGTGTKVLFSEHLNDTNSGFILGRMDSSYTKAYVRKIGDNNIYREPGRLSYLFSVNPQYWVRKKVFYLGMEKKANYFKIKNISITSIPFTIEAQLKKRWILKMPKKPGNERKIDSLSRKIQYLGIKDFITTTNKASTNMIGSITLSRKKVSQTLFISSFITNNGYVCKLDSLPDSFIVETNRIQELFKGPPELVRTQINEKKAKPLKKKKGTLQTPQKAKH